MSADRLSQEQTVEANRKAESIQRAINRPSAVGSFGVWRR